MVLGTRQNSKIKKMPVLLRWIWYIKCTYFKDLDISLSHTSMNNIKYEQLETASYMTSVAHA